MVLQDRKAALAVLRRRVDVLGRGGGGAIGEAGAVCRLGDPALHYDDTIFTVSARTRGFNGQGVVPRFTYLQATKLLDGDSRVSDPLDRELRVYRSLLRGTVGLHEDVTLSITVPHFVKELERGIAGRRRNACGFAGAGILNRMLASNISEFTHLGALRKDVQKPATFILELLDFIRDELPRWRDRPERKLETSETYLTSQPCLSG